MKGKKKGIPGRRDNMYQRWEVREKMTHSENINKFIRARTMMEE